MARGSESKQIITNKILETFAGSFLYNDGKEIRIPIVENGETIQIKVALTAAKVNVESGDDVALPFAGGTDPNAAPKAEKQAITAEEKREVDDFIRTLNL